MNALDWTAFYEVKDKTDLLFFKNQFLHEEKVNM